MSSCLNIDTHLEEFLSIALDLEKYDHLHDAAELVIDFSRINNESRVRLGVGVRFLAYV